MKQVYKITYPTGKIYIGKDKIGSARYMGSPNLDLVNEDFSKLPKSVRMDYQLRKEILWESEDATEEELATQEVEMIRKHQSNDPEIGYNRWPKWTGSSGAGSIEASPEKRSISAAGNTEVPAYLCLLESGFEIQCTTKGKDGSDLWMATKAGQKLIAESPLELLALLRLIETRSWDWQANDSEIEAFLKKFELE